MKVISLLQPWASLVVMGAKKIETRSWNTKFRGEILIHASKKWNAELSNLAEQPPFWDFMKEYWPSEEQYTPFSKLPLGAIIGKVTIEHTIISELVKEGHHFHYGSSKRWDFTEQEIAFGDYGSGRYGWLLSDPVKFEKPVTCKGALNLWNCPEDTLRQIADNLISV